MTDAEAAAFISTASHQTTPVSGYSVGVRGTAQRTAMKIPGMGCWLRADDVRRVIAYSQATPSPSRSSPAR
ncbi:MAG: hypothetical protein BGO26_06040 [Actinobacteria bacterium 69-20]|jgi:hypothetical protein|nr:MAG: hypothetical protein BGO26_06040 [Actinobacteria bacterium 69-20]